MSFFDKVVDFFSGGVGSTIVTEIAKHFPPDMSEEQKAQVQLAVEQLRHSEQMELLRLAQAQDEEFNKRIADLEGTAADLKGIPILGPLVIFLRGCQRPAWGFATMWMDFMWFSKQWVFNDQQDSAAYAINFLVLGFLFGERAAQNVLPYVAQVFKAKNAA